jgi:hypothetical protein
VDVSSRAVVAVLLGSLALGLGACSSPNGVADPFRSPPQGSRIVIDTTTCDPSPNVCNRYVVLKPVAMTQSQLVTTSSQRAIRELKWKPTRYPEVVDADEGTGYDGSSSRSGGWVNTVEQELHYWNRVGYGVADPPNKVLTAVEAAMRSTPDGVFVRIVKG